MSKQTTHIERISKREDKRAALDEAGMVLLSPEITKTSHGL